MDNPCWPEYAPATSLNGGHVLRWIVRWGIALTLAASLVGPHMTPASAVACAGGPTSYFDGFYHDIDSGYAFEGASAYIVVRPSALCSGDTDGGTNFSNAWSMIAGSSTTQSLEYAQSGFETRAGHATMHFAQYASPAGGVTTKYVSTLLNERHAYRSLWSPTCHCVRMTVDSTLFLQTPFNPYGIWQSPFVPQFFGEASYFTNPMPGTASSPTAFSALGAQRVSDDVLVSMPCTMLADNDNPTAWGRSASSCMAFNIWTK